MLRFTRRLPLLTPVIENRERQLSDYASFAAQLDHVLGLDQRDYDAYGDIVDARCDWTSAAESVLDCYRDLACR